MKLEIEYHIIFLVMWWTCWCLLFKDDATVSLMLGALLMYHAGGLMDAWTAYQNTKEPKP